MLYNMSKSYNERIINTHKWNYHSLFIHIICLRNNDTSNSIANDNLTTNAKPDTSYAYEKTKRISIPNGMKRINEMFLYEN